MAAAERATLPMAGAAGAPMLQLDAADNIQGAQRRATVQNQARDSRRVAATRLAACLRTKN